MSKSKGPIKLSFALSAVLIYALCGLAEQDSTGANRAVAAGVAPQKSQEMSNWGLSRDEEARRSAGCLDCHKGIEDIHNGTVILGCIDCHGGDATVRLAAGVATASSQYQEAKNRSHVAARFPRNWKSSANPQRSNELLNRESLEFIRFVNPGDLRVAQLSCGTTDCHATDVHNVGKSMMTTGAMLWGAALYNNGAFPLKNYRFGESYGADGKRSGCKPFRLQHPKIYGRRVFSPIWILYRAGRLVRWAISCAPSSAEAARPPKLACRFRKNRRENRHRTC